MEQYTTRYPYEIQLSNGHFLTLSQEDRKQRVLITEVKLQESIVRDVFRKNGFTSAFPEVVKPNQSGEGMLKSIDDDWDMHVRFFHFHDGMTAIDAEIETSRKYVDHLSRPDNWISVLYEVWDILKQITNQIWLFHKKAGTYVTSIIQEISIGLQKFKDQTEWKTVVGGIAIGALVGLALMAARDS